ncbi:glycosyltransferase, partial [Eubacteriales bacterium OttesenSCG-928-A19]|nr:glycosyltransferase [Eubacteriales bacterium OttesenSCG-928-A19]
EKGLRGLFSRAFFALSNRISTVKMPYGALDFRIMTRQVVEAVCSLGEVQRFTKGIFSWVGFDTKWITYENVERAAGTTKWSYWGLARYAIDGITAFTSFPLRVISGMGLIISLFAFVYIIIVLVQTMIFGIDVPGYVTTLCATLFLGGVIELSVGIVGEYIGRIYMETKHRPIFLVKKTNIMEETPAGSDDGNVSGGGDSAGNRNHTKH